MTKSNDKHPSFLRATLHFVCIVQAIIDLLLSSGADASLKDKEGRMAKDFDYTPPVAEVEGGEDAHKMEL